MNITYNNISYGSNLITFTDIPNILKVTDEDGGTKATVSLSFNSSIYPATRDEYQWRITFMGETITSVLSPLNAVNKYFYVASSMNSTAASVTNALRNCPTISANFIIQNSGSTVTLTAKKIGQIFPNGITNDLVTNISASYMTSSAVDGEAYGELYGSIINADIYKEGEYVTTLRKNFYNGETAFDLSPVLTTFSEFGKAVPYTIELSSMKNGVYNALGSIPANYTAIGYMVNQGHKFLDNSAFNVAQNYSRGKSREVENNTILYIYEPVIPLSFYKGNSGGGNLIIEYKDSALNTFYTQSSYWRSDGRLFVDMNIQLSQSLFNQAFYIDLTIGVYKIRYNVIKPLQMTEHCQRILWRNSYGGISFFDFTGQKTETRDFDISTYQKSIYDYYTDEMNELDKVYDNDVTYTVTLKSHLIENDGKFIFNDIIQSPKVWTEINGQKYAIILKSVSVDETDNNNVYEATLKYTYSMNPSII